MHLDEEQVQRLLHGELVAPDESAAREHLAVCTECRALVADAEREEVEVHTLLRHLDHPAPRVDAGALMRRARQHEQRWTRWAAGIAVALGLGGASYALPGSPVPAWIEAAVHWMGGPANPSPPAPAPAPGPQPGRPVDPTVAGIAVSPGRDLRIDFTSPHGQALVSLTDGADIVVRAPAGTVTFTSHANRLVIDNMDPTATIVVEIPRVAPRVEIRVEAREIFRKEGPRVTTQEPAASADAYNLRLAPSTP